MTILSVFGIGYELTNEFSYESIIDMAVGWLGYLIELLSLIVLYGYIWKKPYLKKQIWVVFLFTHLIFYIGSILYSTLYTDFIYQMGLPFTIGLEILSSVLIMPMLLANYRYAFKFDTLWKIQH